MIQWPPHSKIQCFNISDEEIAISKRSRLDLADSLMIFYHKDAPRICFIEVSTRSKNWSIWDSKNVTAIEDHIKYDLNFDGYFVKIQRISSTGKILCSKPFRWKLKINNKFYCKEP